MFLTPRPGVSLDNLISSLQTVHTEAFNLRAGGGAPTAHQRLLAHLEWAARSVRMLNYQLSEADVASLVLTRRYELLLSKAGTLTSGDVEVQRVVNGLVSLELDERVEDLDKALKAARSYKERWTNVGDLVALDTNFYLVHPQELKDTDLARLTAAVTSGWAVHVLVPLLVVDELDRLKRDSQARTRARVALKMLNDVFAQVSEDRTISLLRKADDTPGPDGLLGLGPITMELLFDPPNHERLPDPDAEIVDRALAVQSLAGRPVTMVTYDISMALRARYAGLKVVSPPYPEQEDQARSSRGRVTAGATSSTGSGTGQ
jgi:hypothetical protein